VGRAAQNRERVSPKEETPDRETLEPSWKGSQATRETSVWKEEGEQAKLKSNRVSTSSTNARSQPKKSLNSPSRDKIKGEREKRTGNQKGWVNPSTKSKNPDQGKKKKEKKKQLAAKQKTRKGTKSR